MFGGYGIFDDKVMFAIVDSGGRVFFKTDDSKRAEYEQAGTQKHGRMPYHQLPDHIAASSGLMRKWAADSIIIARREKK